VVGLLVLGGGCGVVRCRGEGGRSWGEIVRVFGWAGGGTKASVGSWVME